MATEVIMPQLGESVVEGTITKWLKEVGDPVEEYEALLEVNTDKVDTEVPSPASGVVLATLAPEGAVVRAGTVLAWIGAAGEKLPGGNASPEGVIIGSGVEISSILEEQISPQDGEKPYRPAAYELKSERDLGFISPVVKRIAAEHAVDLYQVQGSGEGGGSRRRMCWRISRAGRQASLSQSLPRRHQRLPQRQPPRARRCPPQQVRRSPPQHRRGFSRRSSG